MKAGVGKEARSRNTAPSFTRTQGREHSRKRLSALSPTLLREGRTPTPGHRGRTPPENTQQPCPSDQPPGELAECTNSQATLLLRSPRTPDHPGGPSPLLLTSVPGRGRGGACSEAQAGKGRQRGQRVRGWTGGAQRGAASEVIEGAVGRSRSADMPDWQGHREVGAGQVAAPVVYGLGEAGGMRLRVRARSRCPGEGHVTSVGHFRPTVRTPHTAAGLSRVSSSGQVSAILQGAGQAESRNPLETIPPVSGEPTGGRAFPCATPQTKLRLAPPGHPHRAHS